MFNYHNKILLLTLWALFEKIISEGKNAISFPLREYWLDIGRMEEYKKANDEYDEVF